MNIFIFLILWLVSLPALAEVSVEVLGTYPAQPAPALAPEQSFYVLLKYFSEVPVRIYVRPFTGGKDSNAILHPAAVLPPGTGETLGWFALRYPGVVNDYRVSFMSPDTSDPVELLTVPVNLEWKKGGAMTDTGQPEWVARLNEINEALWQAEMNNAAVSTSVFDKVIGAVMGPLLLAIPLLAFALSVLAFTRWTGPWRHAGGFPLVCFGLWAVVLLVSLIMDPNSHNLWPFELLIWAALTLVWLTLLFVARKLMGATIVQKPE